MAGSIGGVSGSNPEIGGITPGSEPIKPEETQMFALDSSGRKVNLTEPDEDDLEFDRFVSERRGENIENRVLKKPDDEYFDAQEEFPSVSKWATFDDNSVAGDFEFPEDLTLSLQKLFNEDELQSNSWVSQSLNDAAKTLYALNRDPHAVAEPFTSPWQKAKNQLDTMYDLKLQVARMAENRDDQDHLSIQDILRIQNEEKDSDKIRGYEENIKSLELKISGREVEVNKALAQVDEQIEQLETKLAATKDPLHRTKDLKRQQSPEAQKKVLEQGREEHKAQLSVHAEKQKAAVTAKQQSLDKQAQHQIDGQIKLIATLDNLQNASDEELNVAIEWLKGDIKPLRSELGRMGGRYDQLERLSLQLQYLLDPDSVGVASTDVLSTLKLSDDPEERKRVENELKQVKIELEALGKISDEKLSKLNRLRDITQLLEWYHLETEAPDSATVGEHKGWLQADNDLLANVMDSRKGTAEKLHASIDAKLKFDTDAFFVVDNPAFWAAPKGAVHSAEGMPFSIKAGDVALGPEDYHDGLLFAASEEGEFSDASPLLGQKEQLRDAGDNLVYGLKFDKNGKPIPKRGKDGRLESKAVNHKAWVNQDGKVVYDDVVTIQPVYEQDLTKPLYGYDANNNYTKVNKKKLKEYKGAVRVAHAVKLFFKGTGTRLRDAFNFFKVRTPGAKIQRAIEKMARNPKNVFSGELNNTAFFKLFRDVYSERYKKNVVGLQRFHDLMGVTLSSKLSFSDKESKNGYENAMTTLVMVGAGLMDARDEEGNVFGYHLLDTPAEQVAGVRLDSSATVEQRDQVLRLAKRIERKKLTGNIKSKHLARAGKLVALAAKEKKVVEKANTKAIKEGRMQDVRDANEAAKQKLIETVIAKAGYRLPDDLHRKLEVMRDNLTDVLPDAKALPEPDADAIDFNRSQVLLSGEEVTALEKEVPVLEERFAISENRYYNAILEQDAVTKTTLGDIDAAIENLDQHARMRETVGNTPAFKKQMTIAKGQLEAATAAIASRKKQEAILNAAKARIESRLGKSNVLTEQSRKAISNGILMHCGMTVSADPALSRDVSKYEMTKVKIQKHQMKAAIKLADDVAHYFEAGGGPTGDGVYKILTQLPPLSARDGGRTEFAKDTPPHPLHATTLKSQLSAAFQAEDLATHKNRSGGSAIDLSSLSRDITDILSTSGRLIGKGKKTVNTELAKMLSMHVMVGAKSAKFASNKNGASSGVLAVNKKQKALTAEQVASSKRLAHAVVSAMNREGITPKKLAAEIYPDSRKQRQAFASELNTVWVK